MELIDRLCREHRELEAQARMLLRVVEGESPDAAAVAALRWEMAQALADHLAHEDRAIYDRLMASGELTATQLAWQYRCEHGSLGAHFGRYIEEWPVGRVTREWEAFRAETRKLVAELSARIEREEAVLYFHAERVLEQRRAA